MDAFQTRIVSAILLLALTFAVGYLPAYAFQYYAKRARARRSARRRAQCLQAGQLGQSVEPQRDSAVHTSPTGSVSGSQHSNGAGFGDTLSNDSTEHVIRRRTRTASICSTSSIASRAGLSSTKVLQAFMFFGGGVLLATCFCHLIPEARENFNSYMKKHDGPIESAHTRPEPSPLAIPDRKLPDNLTAVEFIASGPAPSPPSESTDGPFSSTFAVCLLN
jgi:hypothetical protein